MTDVFDFKVYADEPSIIYQFSSSDLPGGIDPDDFGDLCALWLHKEHPTGTFIYESESFTIFLDGGHGLSEQEIHLVQQKARAFVRGLMHGVVMGRQKRGRGASRQRSESLDPPIS